MVEFRFFLLYLACAFLLLSNLKLVSDSEGDSDDEGEVVPDELYDGEEDERLEVSPLE